MFCHIDADAFFASVLVRRRPELRGKPLLALGMGGSCVIAASYEAKAFGVKTGMRLKDAQKLCPQALAVPSDFHEACRASMEIESILGDVCPTIEQMSVDEWFLDLRELRGGIPKDLEGWAGNIQGDIARRVGLTVSAGIAPTKLLAKMASEYRKPAGTTVVHLEDIETFLRDRPVDAIPGIGRRRRLHALAQNWKTSWDFACADPETVSRLFGKPGIELSQELRGIAVMTMQKDDRPRPNGMAGRAPKSISRCRSFPKTRSRDMVFAHLLDHLTYTVMKMRREKLAARNVAVWLRDADYESEGATSKLPQPMDTEEQLLPYIEECFARLWENVPICTQTGLALLELSPQGGTQYSLFEGTRTTDRHERIQKALDAVHERFGRESLARGSALPTKTGDKKPKLHLW